MPNLRAFWGLCAVGLMLGGAVLLSACGSEPTRDRDFVARVGSAVLTAADVEKALEAMPAGMDSTVARDQYIEQWLTGQLLASEARRRGLADREDVMRQLEDNERHVLASALLASLYEDEGNSLNRADLEAYFERNRDRMRLREPYVRMRFVEVADEAGASAVRDELQAMMRGGGTASDRDSMFMETVRRFAIDSTTAFALARSYIPQSRLARQVQGAPLSIIAQMGAGEISPVLETPDSTFVVVQLVERVAAGSEPQLEWVADDVRRQVAIQNRKQRVAREVQRLRTEAEARGELRIQVPDPDS